jgi:hypothetical protein
MKINLKSALKSGLVAGVIISVSAISMVPAVGNQMDLVLASRGLPPLSLGAMIFFCTLSFIFGISLMMLYALAKPPSGSRIKTAVIVSLIFWFLTYVLSNASLLAYGFMPLRLTIIGTVWGLGELLLAGIIGSRLYKEVKQ